MDNLVGSLLEKIIEIDVEPNIISYVLSMEFVEDFEEFMVNLVDKNNEIHLKAYEELKNVLFKKKNKQISNFKSIEIPSNSQKQQTKSHKGKKKFTDINTFKEKIKEKEGRKICDCEGQTHDFMNNCLNCGRIHCYEEGPGPCFFCGEFINYMGEETFRNKDQKSKTLKPRENKIYDDDNDYYKNEVKRKSADKQKMVISIDLATRKIISSTQEDQIIKEKLHKDIKKHLENVDNLYKKLQRHSEIASINENRNILVDLMVKMRHKKPVGIENLGEDDNEDQIIDYGTRVYDEELLASTDFGLCMSLHQPYASLLVAGVKKEEGRNWKTNHRGTLWIAAAAKNPDEDEIEAVECFYRQYYEDDTLEFPRDYPLSCLLGCVFVEDCLDQETYKKQYPNGTNNSPFILICSNPMILPIFYPIVGQHKIYPLDTQLHKCAKLSLRHAKYACD